MPANWRKRGIPESEKKLKEIFAQLPKEFSEYVDFASPMIYPQMVGKNNKWVNETIKHYANIFGNDRVIPILQVVKMPENSQDLFTDIEAVNLAQNVRSMHKSFFTLDQIKGNEIFMKKLLVV